MSRKVYMILNWTALVTMLVINVLSNVLPINGYSAEQIADLYPNLFVPAGFTFGIWIFIYLLLSLHVIYSTYMLTHLKRSANQVGLLVFRINRLFWITCILNVAWLLAWHFLLVGLSLAIMVALFITLLLIFRQITLAEKLVDLGYLEHVSLETPFIIYFSWIAVALVANVTALLVSVGWHPASEVMWTCIMIGVVGIIGVVLSLFWRRPAYTAVIVWAVFGIYSKQGNVSAPIAVTALCAGFICLLAAGVGFWYKRKLLFRSSVQAE